VVATYPALFVLLGSVVLPMKAVVMNLLSISAAFGAVTYVVVQGNLSRLLDFTARPCTIGAAGDTGAAVVVGLERSGRLISGAAATMIGVFLPFGGPANTIVIKEAGIGSRLRLRSTRR